MARDAEAAALRGVDRIAKPKKDPSDWLHEEVQKKISTKAVKTHRREERNLRNEIRDYTK